MGRVSHKHTNKYPFKTEHATGGSKTKGMKRKVKDGDIDKMEALSCFRKLEHHSPTMYAWLMRRKK
tara:strand:- start:176 stop:373 length:198 start_codon:yes stop_codon:yes gene_type:complete